MEGMEGKKWSWKVVSQNWRGREEPEMEPVVQRCFDILSSLYTHLARSPDMNTFIRSFALCPASCQRGNTHSMSYAAKAKTQQFTRRKLNLAKKADQLARLCQADLALIIRKNGKYYTYRSIDHDQWPPPMIEIVFINLTDPPISR